MAGGRRSPPHRALPGLAPRRLQAAPSPAAAAPTPPAPWAARPTTDVGLPRCSPGARCSPPAARSLRRVTTWAEQERAALADALEQLGPDAPTLCEGWATKELAAHVYVREHRPD